MSQMNQEKEMDTALSEVGVRIKELREISDISIDEMADYTGVSTEEYKKYEAGKEDLSFTFIFRCAKRFGLDPTELLKGSSPTLSEYDVNRANDGLPVARRVGFSYKNIAPMFKDKNAQPFLVKTKYSEEDQKNPIHMSRHEGQEFDYITKGSLKVVVDGHEEILNEGDSIYYNSGKDHGMIAVGGKDCEFISIIMGDMDTSYIARSYKEEEKKKESLLAPAPKDPVMARFCDYEVNEVGKLQWIKFKNTDNYNFAYDTVDAIAKKEPDKLAMIHLDRNKFERRFSYADMSDLSNQAANYFVSLGIKRGDKVMLVLKRHYQFWIAMLALHKIGAIAIPATFMLKDEDFIYRYRSADVSAIICTNDDDVADIAMKAKNEAGFDNMVMIVVNGNREGWRNFDEEFIKYPKTFERPEHLGGDDIMVMFFTSGTTGNPKMAAHTYKYALGHYPTARFWHNIRYDGLHLTISDTGWGKALWGKFYGQWMCESAVFVYDLVKFKAEDILPLFHKYNITTFCAPATMYRFFIKEDLSKYDLSSIKYSTTAGEAVNPEVFKKWKEATGLTLMEGFGQTETTLTISNFVGDEPKPGSMGHPSPMYDVRILRDNSNECAIGETGEICINTEKEIPCGLFKEYYNNEQATKEAWHDGYYHTGDTAWKDEDGNFWFVGRIDDIIKSSGYRIGPFEIENVIMELPYVLECAITAVPDPVRGQVVKASVVLTKGTTGTEELKKEIQNYVKNHTAPYKYPRVIEFMDALPKTISGKIKRTELR